MASPACDPEPKNRSHQYGLAGELAGGVLLHGYLKKVKRMKKKYFVLYGDTETSPGRLEYFDSDKKWKSGHAPKRSIVLRKCFNINRKQEGKHKWAIAVYTNADCFSIALDSEPELESWLTAMLMVQQGHAIQDGEELKPYYEHVWQVNVKNKQLATVKNIIGPYRLCLNPRVLKLFKMPLTEAPEMWEFPLMSIRRCGHTETVFFMELGRSAVTGDGELWMQAEDAAIAQNIHGEIINAMRNCAKEDLAPRPRTRSSSANEQSRPASQPTRRQVTSSFTSRDRADSVPSRPRTVSEGPPSGTRPLSVYSRGVSSSPPACSALVSPSSVAYSNESAGSLLSVDEYEAGAGAFEHYRGRYSHCATPDSSLPKESTILEEGGEDYVAMEGSSDQPDGSSDYLAMAYKPALSSSPSSRSVSSGVSRTLSLSCSRGGRPRPASQATQGPPPIKPPLYQPAYMEMSSPVAASWSPPNAADGYMAMKPASTSTHHQGGTRLGTHVRSSSFGGDVPDGYVPMAPQHGLQSREDGNSGAGYMDMKFRRSIPKDVHGGRGRLSPASSSSVASSITSGTPSASYGTPVINRLSEFHLDKVASLLTPSEDDDDLPSLGCRQSRAYSVGSRPDIRRKAPKVEPATPSAYCGEVSRVRAFSVGSRMASSMNKSSSKVNTQQTVREAGTPPSTARNMNQPTPSSSDIDSRKMSLSVPVLGTSPVSASWTNPASILRRLMMSAQAEMSAQSSSDLMEIEYGKESSSKASYVSNDSLSSVDPHDTKDQALSFVGSCGSTDSVGRTSASSNASTSSSRPRTNSRSSLLRTSVKPKLDSRKGRHELERLESVPQGRDQDYIEYGNNIRQGSDKTPKVSMEKLSINGEDSADEYVELARPESGNQSSGYMTMEFGGNSLAVLDPVQCQISVESSDAGSGYMEMNYAESRQRQSASDVDGYLAMDFHTPSHTPRISRNSSRQSSFSGETLPPVGAFSPQKGGCRSGSQSVRHSRTEESLDGDCMEMFFHQTEKHRQTEKSVRTRGPSPSTKLELEPVPVLPKASKHSGFLSNLLGRKNSTGSAPKSPPSGSEPSGNIGVLPRSSRSMPPSPFSSLKRQKKKKGSEAALVTAVTPVESRPLRSPDYELPLPVHRRCNSMKATLSFGIRGPHHTVRSPSGAVTPPSPAIDALMKAPVLDLKPSSSQPISIVSAIGTPRSSPGVDPLRRPPVLRTIDPDDYVLPQTMTPSISRYSSSPARTVAVPTLSPLPEVSMAQDSQINPTSTASLSPYVNMSYGEKVKDAGAEDSAPAAPTSLKESPKRITKSDDKENSLSAVIPAPVEKSQSCTTVVSEVVPANGTTGSSSKPRATSLEKIVGAFDKVKIRPKRHSSGDKPVKRTSATTIFRSNSYQPTGNRGGKTSVCPPLTDIPAGRVVSSGGGVSSLKSTRSPPQQSASAGRISSSSLASLGEEWMNQPNDFTGISPSGGGIVFTASSLSAPLNNSPSPSPSSCSSRPPSVLSEKGIHYAQLDLAPAGSLRNNEDMEDLPKSPRNVRPGSSLGFSDLLNPIPLTTYARIDFAKSEGFKTSFNKEQPDA